MRLKRLLPILFVLTLLRTGAISLNTAYVRQTTKGPVALMTAPARQRIMGLTTLNGEVLGASTSAVLTFNVPAEFKDVLTVARLNILGGITQGNTNVNGDLSSTGKITASNLVYSVKAGSGISVSGTQDLTITSTDKGSDQKIYKTIKVGSTSVDAGSNTDTLIFAGGSGVGVSLDTSSKTVTYSVDSAALNVSGWTDDGTVVRLSTSTDNVGIGTASPTNKLTVSGNANVTGNFDIGGTLGVTGATTFSSNATIGTGHSLLPANDLGADLGSSSFRFNNLWVANINSNSSQSFSGQTTFSYAPTDSTLAQASVLINPTTASPGGQLLGFGIAGFEKAAVDSAGNIILGYSGNTSVPATSNPLTIYGHNTTLVGYMDALGNFSAAGHATFSGSLTSSYLNTPGAVLYAQSGGQITASAAGTSGQCLLSGGTGSPTWGSCLFGSPWQLNGTTVSPANSTFDLAIGGTATSSALFQVYGTSGSASMAGTLTTSTIQPPTGPLTFNYKSAANTWAAAMTIAPVTGNVGIGTVNPTALLHIASTSTTFPANGMGYFDWSPASAATTTGDVFGINVGANGIVGNIFNVKNNGTSVFSVSQTQITNSLPTAFNAAGDVTMGYDLSMINPVSSFIKSNSNLYLQAGETFNSSDLTLRTFNSGNIVLDAAGGVTLNQAQNWTLPTSTNALNVSTGLLNVDTTNRIVSTNGLFNVVGPATVSGTASISGTLTTSTIQPPSDALTFNYKSGADAYAAAMTVQSTTGYVGIGTTNPGTALTLGSGQVSVPNGSASAPSYSFSSSANSGMYWDGSSLDFAVSGTRKFYTNAGTGLGVVANGITVLSGNLSLNSGVITQTGAGNNSFAGNVGIGTTAPGSLLDVQGGYLNVSGGATVSATYGTGIAMQVSANSLSSGTGLYVSSTSTSYTTGTLAAFDWSPGSSTIATGDLFSLNVGANGIIGNIFNVKNNGSSVFSVSQTQVTSALPTAFTSPGDTGIAYDIQMTNPVSSFIKSAAPLYLQAGENFNSSDLTLRTFNSGNIVLDAAGGVTLTQAQNWSLPTSTNAMNIASGLFNIDTTNRILSSNGFFNFVGAATISGTASISGALTADTLQPSAGGFTLNYKSGANAYTAGLVLAGTTGNIGLGTANPLSRLDINGGLAIGGYAGVNAAPTNGLIVSGLVGIGTTGPLASFDVRGNSATTPVASVSGATNMAALVVDNSIGDLFTASASGKPLSELHQNGTWRWNAYTTGTLQSDSNGNITAFSDARLKNIQGPFTRGLADIIKLDPELYKWNAISGYDQVNTYAGFIAQNVQTAIPEAVMANSAGLLSLSDRPILAAAVNAIKEQNNQISLIQGQLPVAQPQVLGAETALAGDNYIAWKAEMEDRLTAIEATQAGLLKSKSVLSDLITKVDDVYQFLGDILVKGKATFEQGVTFLADVVFKGRVTHEDKDAGGFAIIEKDMQEVPVSFVRPYDQKPLVNITAEDFAGNYFLHQATAGGFLIRLASPAAEKVTFQWTATSVKDPVTVEGSQALPTPTPVPTAGPTPSPTVAGVATDSGVLQN